MDYNSELDRIYNETQDKLANAMSILIRDINNKDEVVIHLKKMKNQPTIDILQRINRIAIKNEDYETCEALKEYTLQMGITL